MPRSKGTSTDSTGPVAVAVGRRSSERLRGLKRGHADAASATNGTNGTNDDNAGVTETVLVANDSKTTPISNGAEVRSKKRNKIDKKKKDSDAGPLEDLDEWQDYKVEQDVLNGTAPADFIAQHGAAIVNGSTTNTNKVMEAEDKTFNPIDKNKDRAQFRNYVNSARQLRVETFYKTQHTNMTYDFVLQMEEKYGKLNHFEMGIWEALEYLSKVVDDSDPDTNLSQLEHALQTAESCRVKFPGEEYDWIHLTGLIHDLGKILAVNDEKLGLKGEPQWAVVGDTFPVGMPYNDRIVFHQFFAENPDQKASWISNPFGLYSKKCGLSNVHMSWGHDEYIYRVCVGNGSTLPLPALYMLRYHSAYPIHRENQYLELCDEKDLEMLDWVKKFNECDLYSKSHEPPKVEELAPYYKKLIAKYFPPVLKW